MSERTAVVKLEKSTDVVGKVQARIDELASKGHLDFPPNYSVPNALQSAWQAIQDAKDSSNRPALEVCSKSSIYEALFRTVVQGLNPGKKQVYYIVYGDQLQAARSYFGTLAVLKRLPSVKDVYADVVYKGDTLKARKENGTWVISAHIADYQNIDNENIVAAYCTIVRNDGTTYTEIMNWKQIQQSWSKSRSRQQTVHKEFPDQMAKRTVINRACKYFVNTSDDSDLIIEAFNQTGDRYENENAASVKEVQQDKRLEALNAELAAQKKEEKETAVEVPEDEIRPEEAEPAPEEKEQEAAEDVSEQICLN